MAADGPDPICRALDKAGASSGRRALDKASASPGRRALTQFVCRPTPPEDLPLFPNSLYSGASSTASSAALFVAFVLEDLSLPPPFRSPTSFRARRRCLRRHSPCSVPPRRPQARFRQQR